MRKVICFFSSRPPSPPLVPTVHAEMPLFSTLPARPRSQLGYRVGGLHRLLTTSMLNSVGTGSLAGTFARHCRYSRLYSTGLHFDHSLNRLVLLYHLFPSRTLLVQLSQILISSFQLRKFRLPLLETLVQLISLVLKKPLSFFSRSLPILFPVSELGLQRFVIL